MTRLSILAVSALLALGACSGGSDEQGAAPEGASAPTPAAKGAGLKVTPEYLAGDWCYLRYEAGGETSEENITYVFAADGTLKYQTNSQTPVDKDGSYALDEGVIVIKPALAFFKFVPIEVSADGMILEAMGSQSFWTRGACAG